MGVSLPRRMEEARRTQAQRASALRPVISDLWKAIAPLQTGVVPRLHDLDGRYQACIDPEDHSLKLYEAGKPEPILSSDFTGVVKGISLSQDDVDLLPALIQTKIIDLANRSTTKTDFDPSLDTLDERLYQVYDEIERFDFDRTDPREVLTFSQKLLDQAQAIQDDIQPLLQAAVQSGRTADSNQFSILSKESLTLLKDLQRRADNAKEQDDLRRSTLEACREVFPKLNWDYDRDFQTARGTFHPTHCHTWSQAEAAINVSASSIPGIVASFSLQQGATELCSSDFHESVKDALLEVRNQMESLSAGLQLSLGSGGKSVTHEDVQARLDPSAKQLLAVLCQRGVNQRMEGENYSIEFLKTERTAALNVFHKDNPERSPLYTLYYDEGWDASCRFESQSKNLTHSDIHRLSTSFTVAAQKLAPVQQKQQQGGRD